MTSILFTDSCYLSFKTLFLAHVLDLLLIDSVSFLIDTLTWSCRRSSLCPDFKFFYKSQSNFLQVSSVFGSILHYSAQQTHLSQHLFTSFHIFLTMSSTSATITADYAQLSDNVKFQYESYKVIKSVLVASGSWTILLRHAIILGDTAVCYSFSGYFLVSDFVI